MLLAAELFNPTKEYLIEGRFHVEEFDAHADTRLQHTNYGQGLHDLIFARQSCANAATHFERLRRANKSAGNGKIGGYATGGRAGFEIEQNGVGSKRITNGISPVAHCDGAPRAS